MTLGSILPVIASQGWVTRWAKSVSLGHCNSRGYHKSGMYVFRYILSLIHWTFPLCCFVPQDYSLTCNLVKYLKGAFCSMEQVVGLCKNKKGHSSTATDINLSFSILSSAISVVACLLQINFIGPFHLMQFVLSCRE